MLPDYLIGEFHGRFRAADGRREQPLSAGILEKGKGGVDRAAPETAVAIEALVGAAPFPTDDAVQSLLGLARTV